MLKMKNRNKIRVIFFALNFITFFSSYATATEIDSFSLRFSSMKDATARVDQITKELLIKAVNEANNKGASCDEAKLYSRVRKNLGSGVFWSNIENVLVKDQSIDKRLSSRSESIFADLSPFESIPIFVANLGSILQIGEHVVGTDKFGHFFEDGAIEFEQAFVKGLGVEEGLNYGEKQENGLEGIKLTGVYSFADLVSNFKGMMFYKRLTDHYLEEGETPYVSCRENQWVLNEIPSWSEIVDWGMDEALNCNRYASTAMEKKIKNRISQLEEKYQRPFQCPLSAQVCKQMKEKYEKEFPMFYQRIISPECLNLR